MFFCLLLIAVVFLYGFYKLGKEIASSPSAPRNDGCSTPLKISLIQGNIPQSLKWDDAYRGEIIKRYFDLTLKAAKDKPDIIIWPETSFPADLDLEPVLARNLFNLAKVANTYLLIGANRYKDRNIYNSAFLIGPDGVIKGHYDKTHLVPFGEFMPKIPKFMYKILPDKINMVGDFTSGKEYTVFQMHKNVIARNDERERGVTKQSPSSKEIASLPSVARNDVDVRFSTLICFEDVFPELSRQMVKNGANMLVNITNDGWYGISGAPFQHAQASVFRAVDNRVPVVRAANTGYSVFIDEKGKIIDKIAPFTSGYKTKELPLYASPRTFYNTHPYIFIGISFLLSLIGFGIILLNSSLRARMK